jgi:hypothetical protein
LKYVLEEIDNQLADKTLDEATRADLTYQKEDLEVYIEELEKAKQIA